MNVQQGSSISQSGKARMLHVHDHRPRREAFSPEPAGERIAENLEHGEQPTAPMSAGPMTSSFDATVEQPAVTNVEPAQLPPIQVHDADLQRTAEMPRVAPMIDFPVDDEPHVEVGRGAAFAIILLILVLVSAFALVARHVGGSLGTTGPDTLPPLTSSAPAAAPTPVPPTVTVAAPPTVAPTTAAPTTAAPATATPSTVPVTVTPTAASPTVVPTTVEPAATVPAPAAAPTVSTVVASPPPTTAGAVGGP